MKTCHIAIDFGAESARVMLGTLEEGRLVLEEIHRFSTGGTSLLGGLHWNLVGFFEEVKKGLRKVGERGIRVESLSADSWAVDYAYFHEHCPLIAQPHHYRHPRASAHLHALSPEERDLIYSETGIQFMTLNTLYQLLADQKETPWVFEASRSFLTVADYIHYLLGGRPVVDASNASTTQVYNPRQRRWSAQIIEHFGLPERIFPEVVPCGTPLGRLREDIAEETAMGGVQVVATCSHDTAAAVAGVPAVGQDWAYLSSGTWSLMGVELAEALINREAQEANFTNEVGYGDSIRFLKNITGLWILQECKRQWDREQAVLSYAQWNEQALEAPGGRAFIDPAEPRFGEAGHMVDKVRDYCRETGQHVPETPGELARCIFESLALLYAETLDQIRALTGRTITKLHIVGGGSQSQLLNQCAADACGITVLAGPVEATAAGNVLLQALALGHIRSLAELRAIVRDSFEMRTYAPTDPGRWAEARRIFQRLRGK